MKIKLTCCKKNKEKSSEKKTESTEKKAGLSRSKSKKKKPKDSSVQNGSNNEGKNQLHASSNSNSNYHKKDQEVQENGVANNYANNRLEKSAGCEITCVEKSTGSEKCKSNNKACTCTSKTKEFKCIRQIRLEESQLEESRETRENNDHIECPCRRRDVLRYPEYRKHRYRNDLLTHLFSYDSMNNFCYQFGVTLSLKDPLFRGMLSYAILWPLGCLLQDYMENGIGLANANWCKVLRFTIFGALFMAPTLHVWLSFTSRYVKDNDIKRAVIISLVEHVTYTPLAFVYFFIGMNLLEFKSIGEAWNEVKMKFWPTYKASSLFWPTVQTLNFYFIPKNLRIVVVCFCSFVWMMFMAHMKCRKENQVQETPQKRTRSKNPRQPRQN